MERGRVEAERRLHVRAHRAPHLAVSLPQQHLKRLHLRTHSRWPGAGAQARQQPRSDTALSGTVRERGQEGARACAVSAATCAAWLPSEACTRCVTNPARRCATAPVAADCATAERRSVTRCSRRQRSVLLSRAASVLLRGAARRLGAAGQSLGQFAAAGCMRAPSQCLSCAPAGGLLRRGALADGPAAAARALLSGAPAAGAAVDSGSDSASSSTSSASSSAASSPRGE